MTHNILIPRTIMAKHIDMLNRSAVHATEEFDNGNLVSLGGFSTDAGEGEVFVAEVPATATLKKLWMVYSEEIITTVTATGLKLRNIEVNPQAFFVPAGTQMRVFKPQVGDIVTLTDDGLGGTKGANTFAVAADGEKKLQWAAEAVAGLSLSLLSTERIPMPNGSIGGSAGIVAYRFEVVATE